MPHFLLIAILCWMAGHLGAQSSPARVVVDRIQSQSLENQAGESTVRRATVYLPPGYDDSDRRYPVIYYLHGFTWSDSLNLVESRFDTLFETAIRTGKIPPAIIVNADHHTRFRGSWYTNSSYTGRWDDFMTRDLVRHMDERYRTIATPRGRGITGHSMGGYGALKLGMMHPDVFGVVYGTSPPFCALDEEFAADSEWYRRVQAVPDRAALIAGWDEFGANVVVSVGQALTPNPSAPPFHADLPFTYVGDSLTVHDEVLAVWKAHTLIDLAHTYRRNLTRLTALKFDWGWNDEFGTVRTARRLSQTLEDLGIPHDAEEYLGGHSDRLNTPDGRLLNDVLPFFSRNLNFNDNGNSK